MNLEPCDVVLNCPVLNDALKILSIDLDSEKCAEGTGPQLDTGTDR